MALSFVLGSAALYLNHVGWFYSSRHLFLTTCNLAVLFADLCLKFNVNVEVYYFVSALVAFVLFERTDKKHIALSVAWPIMFLFLPRILSLDRFLEVPLLTTQQVIFFEYANYIGAIVLIIYFAHSFFKSLSDFQQAITTANKFSAIGEMSAELAHEINNPVAIILGKYKIIQKKISRNAEGDPFELLQISVIVKETLNLCEDRYKSYGIQLHTNFQDDEMIFCRESQISQVLINLIGNSSDAISKMPEPWIRIESYKLNQRVQIHVTDSGLGIPKHVVEKMMNPFFTTKAVGKGTGLGLSISKNLLQEHGGDLLYDSNSKNTKFILDFPQSQFFKD